MTYPTHIQKEAHQRVREKNQLREVCHLPEYTEAQYDRELEIQCWILHSIEHVQAQIVEIVKEYEVFPDRHSAKTKAGARIGSRL
jgi:hypothetical protein